MYEHIDISIRVINTTTEEQREIERIIINIANGKKLKKDKQTLVEIIKKLRESGAEAIILGCTEIPLIIKEESTVQLIDSNDVLAEAAFNEIIE